MIVAPTILVAQYDFEEQYRTLEKNEWDLTETERLHQLFQLDWEYNMAHYPEWATWEGRFEYNDRWTDNSLEAIKRRDREMEWSFNVLYTIQRGELSEEDQLNYDLYLKRTNRALESRKYPSELMPINQLGGVHQSAPRLFNVMPRRNVEDYQNILARMRKLPTVIENAILLMRKGLADGVTPPKVTLRDIPEQIQALLPDDPTRSPLYEPFTDLPDEFSDDEASMLQGEAVEIFKAKVAPAYRKLHDFMTSQYIPGARESVGMSELPYGREWYAHRVAGTITIDMPPEDIHELGLKEVARIRSEMEEIVRESHPEMSLEEFEEFLRTDPQFYFDDPDDLLVGYRDICKRADPELAHLFGTLPRMPYGVIKVPDYMAKSQTTAYYVGGSNETGRPGYFYANTYDLKSRPKWEMEPLALHEAVPGHHLQIALAQELDELPQWRRDAGYTAFVEGWGLYSESLGEDMGFYTTPYTKYGQLSYEMWRAVRLVVDVGIHHMGWTRQQAIDYFAANSGKPLHDIEVEIDRYIVWPGQALAYKIGQLKILELRAFAKEELGQRFDIREFHDQVLGAGAIPLDVLQQRIEDWVAETKNEGK